MQNAGPLAGRSAGVLAATWFWPLEPARGKVLPPARAWLCLASVSGEASLRFTRWAGRLG